MMLSDQIRSSFLSFFKKNNHQILPSSSVIPLNDPSLMFVNSGMVQFKKYFTNLEKPKYKRIATSQKCIRAGGKHNDLDNVGFTPRHHTFFEMMGNFSFGDYFKEDAIELAWNFLTKELEIDKNKLIVTVYHTDEEARTLWKKISNLKDDKILSIKSSDNFWSMEDNGPCGPCSEIFFDNGRHISGGLPGTKEQDGDRFTEIWNLVFIQFNKQKNQLIPLETTAIDTGMGLERVTSVMQNVTDNYETDLFYPIIKEIEQVINEK